MCFADVKLGASNRILTSLGKKDTVKALFNENIGVVFQANAEVEAIFAQNNIEILRYWFCDEWRCVNVHQWNDGL